MKDINNEQVTQSEQAMQTEVETPSPASAPNRKYKGAWWADLIAILCAFFFSQFAGALICFALGITPPEEHLFTDSHSDEAIVAASEQSRFIACTTLFAIIICIGFITIYKRIRGLERIIQFRTPGWASPFRLLCGYLLLWCFSIAIEPLTLMLPGDQNMLGGGGWLLISAIFFAPFFEEIIFRGYIGEILKKSCGFTVAWLVSSLLFGIAHGTPSIIVSATVSGLVLGFYYLRYRSLVLVILLHAMNNTTACFMHTLGLSDTSIRELLGAGNIYWAIYALALSISIIAIARMWQVMRELNKNKYIS